MAKVLAERSNLSQLRRVLFRKRKSKFSFDKRKCNTRAEEAKLTVQLFNARKD